VLFIDHDETEICVRQKQRGAGADDDGDIAIGDRAPGAGAAARRQLRMPFRRTGAEPRGEAVEELCRQRDLRHQHEALATAADGFGDRLEIDLGLA